MKQVHKQPISMNSEENKEKAGGKTYFVGVLLDVALDDSGCLMGQTKSSSVKEIFVIATGTVAGSGLDSGVDCEK
nr:unnamed protein product [Callosobruchus analis]